ncbi:MAG: FAD-dependent oxidoreductase, partial [Pseudomonadota bacterium]
MNQPQRVTIAGAGWAGLAAALELDRHGVPITLLESARHPGGRARSVPFDNLTLDNGQHLLIGAYSETLRLLQGLGIGESSVLSRQPLDLEVIAREPLHISAPPLPAPLHLLWGLISAHGITPAAKARAVVMSLQLALRGYRLQRDISVAQLLSHYSQPPALIQRFWEPLCLATLNTPLERASARVFLRVLKDSFLHRRHDADLLIPKVPLGQLLAEPALAHLRRNPAHQITTRSRVTGLHV